MRNFQKQGGWRHILESKPVLILFGIFILFFAWSVIGFWTKMYETGKNKKIAEDKVFQLEQQKQKLSSDINSLQTDEGKEKFFRENLGLAKEGEDLIVVVEDKNPAVIPEEDSGGFFSFFRNLFK
ncbi:MAG: septum formation initiator family protein [Candidatus Paceibacterota bacterium]